MTKKADEALMEELHGAVARELLRRIKEGTATAADINVARQFLKDNNVNADDPQDSPLGALVSNLPFLDDTYPN
ncbi:hypothetical protein [Telmatospirillum sp. J64-1]|uniref:hypothetical protein n=1 Tax=Telmatospirillum sp. J64-1 TaxID=2502183 RepID=UPI00115E712C|nr:hypothetical protein [Telmatospirillum sp. J64-1]